jgi:hypothetical protein
MGFQIGTVEYEDLHDCLREALSMVRTGTFRDDLGVKVRDIAASALSHLQNESRRNAGLFDAAAKLQLVNLEAEWHQLRGNFHDAAKTLEEVWQQLKPRLDAWSSNRPLEVTRNRNLLRQKIWASLNYIHSQYIVLADNPGKALKDLLRLKDIIEVELRADECIPLGPLAKCHYLIGCCYNALELADAEQHLLEAQRNTNRRAERERNRNLSAMERRYEMAYKDVFSACILSGLARVSMHRGQLVRAEHLLHVAKGCLLDTQQEALNLFIESFLWTATRRRLPYSSGNYVLAMEELQKCAKSYEKVQHTTGEVHCILEIARGYLDLAEGDKDQKDSALKRAEGWLRRMNRDRISAKWPGLRRDFLHARLCILRGKSEEAEEILLDTRRPAAGDDVVLGVSYSLNEVALLLQSDPPRIERAEMMLRKCLTALREKWTNVRAGDVRHDPIYEARCYLLLAKTRLLSKDIRGAQKYLDDWKVLSQFVESYFLHHLGESLQREIYREGPIFEQRFDLCDASTIRVIKTVPEALQEYERWLRSVLGHTALRRRRTWRDFTASTRQISTGGKTRNGRRLTKSLSRLCLHALCA